MGSKKGDKSDKERIASGQILVRAILEIAGAPKDHIEKSILLLVDKLEEKEYVDELVSEEILEAKEHAQHEGLFTCIAELELWMKKPVNLVDLAFDFMPASIEVLEPEKPAITNKVFSSFMNELVTKLHRSDMVVKNTSAQKQLLERNSNILLRNFLVSALRTGDKSLEELSKIVGIPPEQLEKFLSLLEKGGEVKQHDGKYSFRKLQVSAKPKPEAKDSVPEQKKEKRADKGKKAKAKK